MDYFIPTMVVRIPVIDRFIDSKMALVVTAMHRVILSRKLPDLSRGLVPSGGISRSGAGVGVDVVLNVNDVGDSVIMHCEGRAS